LIEVVHRIGSDMCMARRSAYATARKMSFNGFFDFLACSHVKMVIGIEFPA